MKNSIAIIVLLFAFTCANAQVASVPESPATPSISESSSSKTRSVKVSVNKNRKLNLKIDDDQFKMKLTFPKKYEGKIKKEFLNNFRNSGDNYIWNGQGEETKVKIRSNKVNIHFLKEEITAEEMSKIKTFTTNILDLLDWEIDSMDLWEYSGDWSLSNGHERQ